MNEWMYEWKVYSLKQSLFRGTMLLTILRTIKIFLNKEANCHSTSEFRTVQLTLIFEYFISFSERGNIWIFLKRIFITNNLNTFLKNPLKIWLLTPSSRAANQKAQNLYSAKEMLMLKATFFNWEHNSDVILSVLFM